MVGWTLFRKEKEDPRYLAGAVLCLPFSSFWPFRVSGGFASSMCRVWRRFAYAADSLRAIVIRSPPSRRVFALEQKTFLTRIFEKNIAAANKIENK